MNLEIHRGRDKQRGR